MASTAQALSEKILALLKAGQFGRATKSAKLAHKKFPKEAYFANLVGMALSQSGNAREAAQFFHKAFRLQPQNEDFQNNLVQALVVSAQHEKAQSLIAKLMPKRSETSELLYLHAMSLMQNGDGAAALDMVAKTIAAKPNHAKAHNLRGMLLSDQGRDIEAINSYQTSLELAPDRPDTLSNISLPLSRVNRGDEALAMLERAISINPAHLNALQRYAIQLNEAGRQAEAKQTYHVILGIVPDHAETLFDLSLMQSSEENAAQLPAIKTILSQAPKNAPARVHLNFALANIFWQQKDFEKAAKALDIANAQEARLRPFDATVEDQQKEAILRLFAKSSEQAEATKAPAAPSPIFVIGLPRSGTTLVEQIITAHENVTGFGELASAGRLAAKVIEAGTAFEPQEFATQYRQDLPNVAQNSPKFVDKMPANYRYVGLLAQAFPDARFVCLKRDPRDVALSMWRTYFSSRGMDYTFDLAAIAKVANGFAEYMDHWQDLYGDRILEIRYEGIVEDIDAASRTLAQFCGLEWVAAMARPDQNTSFVRTASLAQVREGVHTRSIGGWARMADQLEPFIQGLDKTYWPDLD